MYKAFEKTDGYVTKWRLSEETDQPVRYNSQYKLRAEMNWQDSLNTSNGYRRFNHLHEGRWYDFRVQSASAYGGTSVWVEVTRMVPTSSSRNPALVKGFDAVVEDGNVKLTFDRYSDTTVVRFQIKRTYTPAEGAAVTHIFSLWNQPDIESHVDMGATDAGTYEYRMRAVNHFMENNDRMGEDTWSPLATVTK